MCLCEYVLFLFVSSCFLNMWHVLDRGVGMKIRSH